MLWKTNIQETVEPYYHRLSVKWLQNPKQHKEGLKFWILQVSCSPLSCVIRVSFQGCRVGFHLPAGAVGYSAMSPWAMRTAPCSTFCLLHQLGWSPVMLIGLVIFLHKYFLSLRCYSAVLWQKTLIDFAWTPSVPCVLESLLALVSQGNDCLSTDTITAVYFGNKSLRRRL